MGLTIGGGSVEDELLDLDDLVVGVDGELEEDAVGEEALDVLEVLAATVGAEVDAAEEVALVAVVHAERPPPGSAEAEVEGGRVGTAVEVSQRSVAAEERPLWRGEETVVCNKSRSSLA